MGEVRRGASTNKHIRYLQIHSTSAEVRRQTYLLAEESALLLSAERRNRIKG
jgi:hypothetical protein